MSGPYRIELLDSDGCELSVTEESTLREAKRVALEKMREPCYSDWRKAGVLNVEGEVIWDRYRNACNCCGELMAPGQTSCCTDEFPEPSEMRETGR